MKFVNLNRSKLITILLAISLFLSFSMTVIGASMSAKEDGLEVSITTDKDEYSSSDIINATLSVHNTNDYQINNLIIKILTPDGYRLIEGSTDYQSIPELFSNTTKSLDSSFIKISNPIIEPEDNKGDDTAPNSESSDSNSNSSSTGDNNSSNSNNNSSNSNYNTNIKNPVVVPNASGSNTNTNTTIRTTSRNTQSNNNYSYPSRSTTYGKEIANTSDNSQLLMWVGIALSAILLFAFLYHLRKEKGIRGKHFLSVLLVLSLMSASLATGFQKVSAEETTKTKEISVITNIKIDEEDVSIVGLISYDDPETSTDSDDVILTRYEWIRRLVEQGGYDLDTVADTEPFYKDVKTDNPYYPYVQIAHMWNLLDDSEIFNGDDGANEWFVAQTAMRSLGDTKLQSLLNKEVDFTDEELFRQATIYNIALASRGKPVTENSCEARLNALTDLLFSDAANQEYENIKLNANVVEFSDPVDIEEESEDRQMIWSNESINVVPGTIVAYHDKDNSYSAGKVTTVIDENSDITGYVIESTDIDDIFDTYIARDTIDVDINLIRDYLEQYSVEDYSIDDTAIEPTNTAYSQLETGGFESLLFKDSSDIKLSDLLNRNGSPRLLKTGSNHSGYELTVKIESGKLANKTTISVKDLSAGDEYSYIMDPKKFTLDDSEFDESNAGKKMSVTLTISLKDPKLNVAASIKRNGFKLNPNFSVNASSDVTFGAKGNLKGTVDFPLLGNIVRPFDYTTVKYGVFLTGSLSGEIDSSISIPYRLSLDLTDAGLKCIINADATSTLKAVLKGELGVKPEVELRLLNESNGVKINGNQFVGIGGDAEYINHGHIGECIDTAIYAPIAHGSVSADLGIFTKIHAERKLWEVKSSDAKFHRNLHYERYYDGSFKGFVDECTFKDYGTLTGSVIEAIDSQEKISDAEITVYRNDEIVASAISDLNGKFSITLPVGTYRVDINKIGYQDYSSTVTIEKDYSSSLKVALNKNVIITGQNSDYEYEITNGSVRITKYIGSQIDVLIPKSIDGFPVEVLGEYAFCSIDVQGYIIAVTIPNTVLTIEAGCFSDCQNLERVTFEEGSHLKVIKGGAFWDCYKLKAIDLPDTVVEISSGAFNYCYNLVSLELPKHLEIIDGYFINGTLITSITIPKSVTTAELAFYKFYDVHPGSNNTTPYSDNNPDFEIYFEEGMKRLPDRVFEDCLMKDLHAIHIPDSVTEFGAQAFKDCERLESITIPKNIEIIGDFAFYRCHKLKNVVFESDSQLKSIGSSAFQDCVNLRTISLPDSLVTLEDAFSYCINLESIYIPPSVKYISPNIFHFADKVTIYGYSGSYAEEFAIKYKVPFISLNY